MTKRIYYSNTATERYREAIPATTDHKEVIQQAVHEAIARLEPIERELIERYYLQFEDFRTIAESIQLSLHRLETIHRRAIRKLRKQLGPLVYTLFAVPTTPTKTCCICESPNRTAIDTLLANRDRRRPWRITLQQIRAQYGIRIKSVNTLISHQRYH